MNALKLRELALSKGAHKSPKEGVCVMEVVSYIAGEKFSDHPECACPVMSAFLRNWNDALDDEGRQILKQFIPLMVNSRASNRIEVIRREMIKDWYFKVCAPAFLDLAGLVSHADNARKNGEHADWAAAGSAAGIAARIAERISARDTRDVSGVALREAAGDAARVAASTDAELRVAWYVAGNAAWYSARAASVDALKATVIILQKSALQLVRDCLSIKE